MGHAKLDVPLRRRAGERGAWSHNVAEPGLPRSGLLDGEKRELSRVGFAVLTRLKLCRWSATGLDPPCGCVEVAVVRAAPFCGVERYSRGEPYCVQRVFCIGAEARFSPAFMLACTWSQV